MNRQSFPSNHPDNFNKVALTLALQKLLQITCLLFLVPFLLSHSAENPCSISHASRPREPFLAHPLPLPKQLGLLACCNELGVRAVGAGECTAMHRAIGSC